MTSILLQQKEECTNFIVYLRLLFVKIRTAWMEAIFKMFCLFRTLLLLITHSKDFIFCSFCCKMPYMLFFGTGIMEGPDNKISHEIAGVQMMYGLIIRLTRYTLLHSVNVIKNYSVHSTPSSSSCPGKYLGLSQFAYICSRKTSVGALKGL